MNNMLTVEEVKTFLEIDQTELEKYLKAGKIHAYKIGGTYLRFRKEDILTLRSEIAPQKKKDTSSGSSFFSKVMDFWRFNNFYIISLAVMAAVAYFVIKF